MEESFLIFSILTLLSVFVFYSSNEITSGRSLGIQINLVGIFLMVTLFVVFCGKSTLLGYEFLNAFLNDELSLFLSKLVIFGVLCTIVVSIPYLQKNSLQEYEFFLVVVIVLLGLLTVIYSTEFLSFYLGIELQSLGLYILASMKNNSTYSTEAGLKYFVLGAFASSILIFGIVLFYGFMGLLNFEDSFMLNHYTMEEKINSKGLVFSLLFIFLSLIFKMGGAPFHVWLPDVYEGVASIVTMFFALVPKISIIAALIKLTNLYVSVNMTIVSILFFFSAFLSVIIGSFGALGQKNTKRLLSYSAITHTGFFLFSFGLGSFEGVVAILFYLCIYFLLILTLFSCLLGSPQYLKSSIFKLVSNLSYVYKSNFWLSICFIFALFSIGGVPPLSGFFAKLFVLIAGIKEGFWFLVFIFIFCSVVSVIYYLRIIRAVLFEKNRYKWVLIESVTKQSAYIISICFVLNVGFLFFGGCLLYTVYNVSLEYMFV